MTGDEAAIRDLLAQQVAGWNSGDPTAYAAVFTPDADYVTFLGAHHSGREAITAWYAPLFANLLRGSRLDVEITGLRFLTAEVALIHARAVVTRNSKRRNRGARVNTSVAVRTGDGWLLASSQNTTRRRLAERLMRTLVYRHADTGGSVA